jgi:type IV fimbrial biogenesis protein FimT
MSQDTGFTLFESLITIALILILSAIAMPAWRQFSLASQEELLRQHIIRALQFAQQQARVLHTEMVMCPTANQVTCTENWLAGQLIFTDTYADHALHTKDQIQMIWQSPIKQGELFWRGFPGHTHYLHFLPSGLTTSANGIFWYCRPALPQPLWAIVISKAGATHLLYPNKNGNLYDAQGKSLSCSS